MIINIASNKKEQATTNAISYETAFAEILAAEKRKKREEDLVVFNNCYLRQSHDNKRKTFYLFTKLFSAAIEDVSQYHAVLIADLRNEGDPKETIVYHVCAIVNGALEPMTNKYFKVLESALKYVKEITSWEQLPEQFRKVSDLTLEEHVGCLENAFTNNALRIAFGYALNQECDALLGGSKEINNSILITAVSKVLEQDPYYIMAYIQSFYNYKNNKLSELKPIITEV